LSSQLLTEIASYKTSYKEEELFVPKFIELLRSTRAFYRDHLPGHITGSAWIVNQDFSKALLIEHAKLKRWLQPGGHADGETDVIQVAMREAQEETGVTNLTPLSTTFFDLDIHSIPERRDFPAHYHYDVRYIFQVDDSVELIINDESTGLKWVSFETIASLTQNSPSIMRMVEKTNQLRRTINQ
jgi:8-oxo-dGTP pyrophosphatase MutT (NUDIX family)